MKKQLFLFAILIALMSKSVNAQPGSLDNSFNSPFVGLYMYDAVKSTATQSDGKILYGGTFGIGRLNTDGSIDNTFKVTVNSQVEAVTLQTDGRILIGGYFTNVNGTKINHIARLNTDGNIDSTFKTGDGCSLPVKSIKIQLDGKIILVGQFEAYNTVWSKGIVRLNIDGSIDKTFSVGWGASNSIESVVIQNDNKIIIGGAYTSFNTNTKCPSITRLFSNGTIDLSFSTGTGLAGSVSSLVIQPDGKIVVAGILYTYNDINVNKIIRINTDGTLDSSFNAGTGVQTGYIYTVTIQKDGKFLIGGTFTSYNGNSTNYLARLNTDGSFDKTFNIGTGPDKEVYIISEQQTGKLIVGGSFANYNGVSKNKIARINNLNPTVSPILTVSPNTLIIKAPANSTKTFDITSNTNWAVSSNQAWLTVSSSTGSNNSTITLTATVNSTTASRTATVTVSGTGVTDQTITIMQDAATTGINEINSTSVILFPNPVTNELTIENISKAAIISIYDVNGRLLINKSAKSTTATIDVRSLVHGVYSIKITVNKTTQTSKLVKR